MHKNAHLENLFLVASFLSFLLVISVVRNKKRERDKVLARPDTDPVIKGTAQGSQVCVQKLLQCANTSPTWPRTQRDARLTRDHLEDQEKDILQ